jgi:hypothetical protein
MKMVSFEGSFATPLYQSKIAKKSVINRYIFNLEMLSKVSGIWSHHDTAAATPVSATAPTVIIIISSTCI